MDIKKVTSQKEFVAGSYSSGKEIKWAKIANIDSGPTKKANESDCCFPSDCQCCVANIFFEDKTKK